MTNPSVEVIETKDGSSSLLLPEIDETYHSTHGAITESKYVILEKGLNYFRGSNPENHHINILEIGFGTGLNAWLTALQTQDSSNLTVQFTTLEKYPLPKTIVEKLPHGGCFGFSLNDHALQDPGYEDTIQDLVEKRVIELVFEEYGDHLTGLGSKSKVCVLRRP